MGKKKSANSEKNAVSFEEALAQLDQIVRDLEDGTVGLEDSMQRFETGIGLVRTCQEILKRAEQRIEVLTGFDAEGNPVSAEFDTTATVDQSEASAGRRKSSTHSKESAEKDDEDGATLF